MEKQARIFASLHPFHEGGEILGRTVANAGFLNALLSANPFDEYHFFLSSQNQCTNLEVFFNKHFPALMQSQQIKIKNRMSLAESIKKTEYYCFHLSDSITEMAPLAALRNAIAKNIFPITGVTHSLSYARYLPHFLGQLWQGRTERDAIIVTSKAGVTALKQNFAMLTQRFNLTQKQSLADLAQSQSLQDPSLQNQSLQNQSLPKMQRIALGVDLNSFINPFSPLGSEERNKVSAEYRTKLNISPSDRVALVLGRFSHHSKMDLLPMLRVVQRASQQGLDLKSFVLILAGAMSEGDDVPQTIKNIADKIGLRLIIIASPSELEKKHLFASADIFISPSDNIQETFGLTILEAAAAGLPVLASDYDGYKDLVQHEKTGYLIPSLGPVSTQGNNLLAMILFDNQYHLNIAQQTVLNIKDFASYLTKLVNKPTLCAQMGQAGQKQAQLYSWDKIILEYLDCWNELNKCPISETQRAKLRTIIHPFSPDFANTFGHYTTKQLDETLTLRWTPAGEAVYRKQDFPIIYAGLDSLIELDLLPKLLFKARKNCTVAELSTYYLETSQKNKQLSQGVDCLEPDCLEPDCLEQESASFIILWCLKHDLLEIVG